MTVPKTVKTVTAVKSGLPGTAVADWAAAAAVVVAAAAAAVAASLALEEPGTQTCCGCGGRASCQGHRAEDPPRRSHG